MIDAWAFGKHPGALGDDSGAPFEGLDLSPDQLRPRGKKTADIDLLRVAAEGEDSRQKHETSGTHQTDA